MGPTITQQLGCAQTTASIFPLYLSAEQDRGGWLRPNHLHPPFNREKARQALLWMVNQETAVLNM